MRLGGRLWKWRPFCFWSSKVRGNWARKGEQKNTTSKRVGLKKGQNQKKLIFTLDESEEKRKPVKIPRK